MSENVIQTSFSAGELSPNLFARVDFAKYRSGAARMRNFFVDYRSGASTRPGTEFVRSCPPTTLVRLVRFQQSVNVTFVLEFGANYLRFISLGQSVVLPAVGITNITNDNPAIVETLSHPWGGGELVYITGVNGMPQINNRYFSVYSPSSGGFGLVDPTTGQFVNSSSWGPYAGGGTVQEIYTIVTPYSDTEIFQLKFSQKGSQMNITHPAHPPYVLTLINATNWTLVPATIGPTVGASHISSVVQTSGGTSTSTVAYKYCVTAIDENGQEGPPSNVVQITGVQDLRVSPGGTNEIDFDPVVGATSYNIYAASPSYAGQTNDTGALGFIGQVDAAGDTVFFDSNISPDFSRSPPVHDNPFVGVNPAVSSYFQQRLFYANGGGELVQTFWGSKTGAPYNFDISIPAQDDDAVTGALVSLEVNEIKSLIPMPSGLIAMTTKGAWQISGGAGGVATQGGPITPSSLTATPQAYIGCSDLPPILINYDITYVQQKGSIVRDLTYNIYANIYTGNDISILSSHLFYGHTIVDWAYAEEPFKIVWAVRDDGILLSLTLVKEQDMYGWARHDTLGNFESVCTVTEGTVDATYVVVKRPLPGNVGPPAVRQIERLADREFPFGAEDAWCVDAGVKSIENFMNSTLTIFLNADRTVASMATSVTCFIPGVEKWIIRGGGGIYKITQYISPTSVVCDVLRQPTDLIPNDPQRRPNLLENFQWTLQPPFTIMYGLDHMEGQPVSVLADGGVVKGLTVTNGQIVLPHPVTKVIVGYGFQAQLQTMYLDLGQENNTAQGKRKKIAALTVRVKDSRGLKGGRTFETLVAIKELNRTTTLDLPVELVTADERFTMDPLWDVPGQICLQLDDPLPATVLGVIPEIVIGDGTK